MSPQCRCVGEQVLLYHGLEIAGRTPPFVRELRDAVRTGRKTQTRRPMKLQPELTDAQAAKLRSFWANRGPRLSRQDVLAMQRWLWCDYGKIGDFRVMPEPLKRGKDGLAHYADDGALVVSLRTGEPIPWRWQRDTLSSIHMPTEAGRTVLLYMDVRAERIQEISDADARAEGIDPRFGDGHPPVVDWSFTASGQFSDLWDEMYAERGRGRDANPWVWVLAFEVV
jgi:hypothetical protein